MNVSFPQEIDTTCVKVKCVKMNGTNVIVEKDSVKGKKSEMILKVWRKELIDVLSESNDNIEKSICNDDFSFIRNTKIDILK